MLLFQFLPPFPPWMETVIDATLLVMLLSNVLFFFIARPLLHQIEVNKQAEAAIHGAYNELELRVRERTTVLEQNNREFSLLAEMSEFLLECVNAEEAYSVIVRTGQYLFPGTLGSLFIYNEHCNELESVATWGGLVLEPDERVFTPEQCLALRRGRGYKVGYAYSGMTCQHVSSSLSGKYLCVPIIARGEVLGAVHLRTNPFAMASADERAHLHERLAAIFIERVAPALANLNLREKLHNLSIRDPLTGLYNRRFMEETLEREIRRAERNQHPLGVIMLDLDHFKQFNDKSGHQAGDLLLRELGALLKSHIRGGDIACRYGGEEFTLIMPNAPLENILQRLDDLRLAMKKINVAHGSETRVIVTGSAGVAMFPEHGDTGETLLSAADRALYRAKSEGRDRVEVADVPEHGELLNTPSAKISVLFQKSGTEKIKLQQTS
jgi:diguanylate cyclase (GGDEF)-like protein